MSGSMIPRRVAARFLTLMLLMVSACGSDGTPDEGTTLDVARLAPGDCVTPISGDQLVGEVSVMPCTTPHAMEVAGTLELSGDDYPGLTALTLSSQRDCIPVFERHVGADFWESRYDLKPIVPSPVSWQEGDRRVICLIVDPDGDLLTTPIEGAGP